MLKIDQEAIDAYRDDGVCCVRDAFSSAWVDALRRATAAVMDRPRPSSTVSGEPGKGRFFTDVNMWTDNDDFRRIAFDSPAIEIAAQVMGATKLNLYNEHLLVKEPRSAASPTPWHQDQPYFRTAGWQICSVWIAIDPVDEQSGAMRFVKGSHRWGKMFQPVRFTSDGSTDADAFDGPVPPIDELPETYETVCYEMAPGDCTVHHGLTLHAAAGNRSAEVWRRGLSLRYAGDDIRYVERTWHPTESTAHLADGDPLDSDEYPVVWRRAG